MRAHRNNATGNVTLTYADGTTSVVSLGLTDWGQAAAYGETPAVQTTHRHNASGDQSLRVRLWHQTLTVNNASQLVNVKLPVHSRMHIFAITLR